MKNFGKIICGIAVVTAFAFVQSANAVGLFNETFSYSDGALTNVETGGLPWVGFSGTTPINVTSSNADLSAARTQDAGALFDGGTAHSNDVVFACLDFNLSVLPQGNAGNGGNGTYFFMFKDNTTSNFRARLWVTTNNAAAGTFRVGIANASAVMTNTVGGNPNFVSSNLTLAVTYTVVIKLDQTGAAPVTTLWLSPSLETDPSVTATDSVANTLLGVTQVALRQATATVGAGNELVDNIHVGTLFTDCVVPEPSTIALVGMSLLGAWAIRRRRS